MGDTKCGFASFLSRELIQHRIKFRATLIQDSEKDCLNDFIINNAISPLIYNERNIFLIFR